MFNEVHIDIGAGERAEYFVGEANHNTDNLYIALDPRRFRCPHPKIYPNLKLIRWATGTYKDRVWELPFKDGSIDQANLNFIFGVMDDVQERRYSLERDEDIYRNIVSSLKRVIKPTGLVFVREPKGMQPIVQDLFTQNGFVINQGPTTIDDVYLTPTTALLYECTNKDISPGTSCFLPQGIVLTLSK